MAGWRCCENRMVMGYRYLAVDSDLAGFAQYLELERGVDGLWWVVRQVDARSDGSRRYGRGLVTVDEHGMLSDQPSNDAELADDEFTSAITADEFEVLWNSAE